MLKRRCQLAGDNWTLDILNRDLFCFFGKIVFDERLLPVSDLPQVLPRFVNDDVLKHQLSSVQFICKVQVVFDFALGY